MLAATVWAALLVLLILFGQLVMRSFIWQPGPIYNLLIIVRTNVMPLSILLYIVGFCLILRHYWNKTANYMEEIVEASRLLVSPDDEAIQLSPLLRQVEDRMNQIRQTALRNERAARDEIQRKNDLIIYLAHDIKTPLTSVIGYLSLLDEAPDMPPEQKAKYVGITLEKAYRLDELIDEFFDITRFNLQHIEVNKSRINLSLMLRQMADEF